MFIYICLWFSGRVLQRTGSLVHGRMMRMTRARTLSAFVLGKGSIIIYVCVCVCYMHFVGRGRCSGVACKRDLQVRRLLWHSALTIFVHAHLQAFLQATRLTLVAVRFVHNTSARSRLASGRLACENQSEAGVKESMNK